MELVLGIVIGIAATGLGLGLLVRHLRKSAEAQQAQWQTEKEKLEQAKEVLTGQLASQTAELEKAKLACSFQTKKLEEERARMDAEKVQEQKSREEQNRQQLELIRTQLAQTTERIMKQRAEELEKTNTDHVEKLMTPLRQNMEQMSTLLKETKEGYDKNTSSLEGAFKTMMEQSKQVGQKADNLAEALKNKGKVHGDWGEQVLNDILRDSGLREGIEFEPQKSFKDKRGGELRPDVVVNCSDGTRIIIDSKVSLTAYQEYVGAADDAARKEAEKRNCDSVKKHVKELADNEYPKYVENSISYVLMFVPNEGSYVLAMNHDRGLAQEAFKKGVVIVNPTNLMLALNLVLQTWHNARQEDNCKEIIRQAEALYDKVQIVADTCQSMGGQLRTVNKTYEKLSAQLVDGTGNLLRKVETLKSLGVVSTKKAKLRKAKAEAEDAALPEGSEAEPTDEAVTE